MQISNFIQNQTYSGLILVFLFATITVFVNNPDSNLEQRVTDLENRVDTLEEKLSDDVETEATPIFNNKAQSLTNWRQLEVDMSYDEVRELLGEPHEISGGDVASWRYKNGGRVGFFLGEVNSWNEP